MVVYPSRKTAATLRLFRVLSLLQCEYIPFRQSAPLRHLIAVVEMCGVVVARIRAEGEFQTGFLRSRNERLVGDVGDLVDLDCQLSCFGHFEDVVDALRRPKLTILTRYRDGEEGRPGEDVDGLGGHYLFDELQVTLHEGFGVVDVSVDLPDSEPCTVGVGERQGVHKDVVELLEDRLGKGFGPSGIDGLQADVHWVFAEIVDVELQVGVGLDGESFAGVFDYADVHSAVFAELQGLVDRQRVAEVDVVVGYGESGLGRRGGFVALNSKTVRDLGTCNESGSGDERGFKKSSAGISSHDAGSKRTE